MTRIGALSSPTCDRFQPHHYKENEMFAGIVIASTGIVLALSVVWLRNPAFRRWVEAPKYQILTQEKRFDRPR